MGVQASIGRTLKQTVTYWSPSSYNRYGDPSFGSPVQFLARWEEKVELFTDKEGQQSHSHAIVYGLDTVAVDGYLYLGTSTSTNPETAGADKIRRVDSTPSIKNTATLIKAYL